MGNLMVDFYARILQGEPRALRYPIAKTVFSQLGTD
jgi:hypothetical protein